MTDPQIQWESHEGMVTVYREDGRYAGCMGAERWERLLQEDEPSRVTDPAAHTPDVDTLAETVQRWLMDEHTHNPYCAVAKGRPCDCDVSRQAPARAALSDLAATAREATAWRSQHDMAWEGIHAVNRRAEAAEADRETFKAALVRITDRNLGDPSAAEIARCALGWPSS